MNRRELLAGFGGIGFGIVAPTLVDADDLAPAIPSGPLKLSPRLLRKYLLEDKVKPESLFGCQIEFVGTLTSVVTHTNGICVAHLTIRDWDTRPDALYENLMVYNFVDRNNKQHFQIGGDFRMTGLIVDRGFGSLCVWHYESRAESD